MRVALLSGWWPTRADPARNKFVEDHARAMEQVDLEVQRWAVHPGTRPTLLADPRVATARTHVPWAVAASVLGANAMSIAGASQHARFRDVDALVVHTFEHAGPFAAGVARQVGIPLIYVEHWSAVAMGSLGVGPLRSLRTTAEAADAVLGVSTNLVSALAALTGRPAGLIRNPVDTSVFFLRPAVRNRTLAVVADFRPVKGHKFLVEALVPLREVLHGWKCCLIGDGPERPRIESAVREASLDGVVEFSGNLPRELVAEVLRTSQYLLLASESENAPLAVLEAMACGTPVIVPDVGGIRDIVAEEDGLIYPRTAAGLGAALRQATEGAAPLRPPAARAAATAATFSPDAVGMKYLDVLAALRLD